MYIVPYLAIYVGSGNQALCQHSHLWSPTDISNAPWMGVVSLHPHIQVRKLDLKGMLSEESCE